jgi:hypothetical protein
MGVYDFDVVSLMPSSLPHDLHRQISFLKSKLVSSSSAQMPCVKKQDLYVDTPKTINGHLV